MSTHETDKIFEDYNNGTKSMEETNAALREAGANFHLEALTAEEAEEKRRREDAAGYVENPNPAKALPKEVDMRRRKDLVGKSKQERTITQHTACGNFRVEYNDNGYAVSATRI